MENNVAQSGGWLAAGDRFVRHPVTQLVSFIFGIAGVVLAIYFYFAGQARPELTYYVHPVRTVVVKAGEASDLTITHKGKVLTGNVSAANVAIWNAGATPIKPEDILRAVTIETSPRNPILEVKIRKVSRPEIEASLDLTKIDEGKATVTSRILERDDEVAIQLVYLGDTNVPVSVLGRIVGQRYLKRVEYTGSLPTPEEQYGNASERLGGIISILVGTLLAAFVAVARIREFKKRDVTLSSIWSPWTRWVSWICLAIGVGSILTGLYGLYSDIPSSPPIGF